MARYRKIDTRIWNDQKFNALTDDGKLAFLFLLTHPHMTALGAMRASLPGLAAERGWSERKIRKALEEALLNGMIKYDEKASFIWLPNFLKYNEPESPNVVRSWDKALDYLPECQLKKQLIYHVNSFAEGLSKAFTEALPKTFCKAMPNQKQEQKQDQDQDKEKPTKEKLPSPINDPIQTIFNYWKKKFDYPNAKLDENRKTIISKALKAGYTTEQLCEAINGCSLTPHNMGYNDEGQRYDGLNVIFRDADNIDRFIRNCNNPPKTPTNKDFSLTSINNNRRLTDDNFDSKQYTQTPINEISWLKQD